MASKPVEAWRASAETSALRSFTIRTASNHVSSVAAKPALAPKAMGRWYWLRRSDRTCGDRRKYENALQSLTENQYADVDHSRERTGLGNRGDYGHGVLTRLRPLKNEASPLAEPAGERRR